MKSVWHTILFPLTALLLVLCIEAPILLKLSHAIYEHQTPECDKESNLHFHKAELVCDFQKFKISTQYFLDSVAFNRLLNLIAREKSDAHYFFLNQYQKLHFVLRGPPSIT